MSLPLSIGAPWLACKSNAGVVKSLVFAVEHGHSVLISQPHRRCWRFSVDDGHGRMHSVSDSGSSFADVEGVNDGGIDKEEPRKSNKILMKLKRYGLAGILSYGLLNTAYYLTTFLLVWFYFTPAPGRMGYLAAVERFFKVMAMVWAGSQVTKVVRAGGALALAPLVDRGLSWFTKRYKFQTQGQAFAMIVGLCFGLAVLVFLAVTVISA
ncbi:hypothetical protein MLD38_008823 [Melastoma candidum]|uniref:Uncharacterized protein n=1 Tax=Melastoma candidum TaxID=119954 RepID=A0ACB9RVS1_9MYRT|nr:hypothetical protein MLD38_008823 [Melastoma candidum]